MMLQTGSVLAVDFTGQKQLDGKSVYSNIPAECVEDGVLICLQYHPMNQLHFQKSQPSTSASVNASSPTSSQSTRAGVRISSGSTADNTAAQASGQASISPQLNVLQQLVEMNRMLDEHFPGQGIAQDRARVQQQQNQIMQLLGSVEDAAPDDMRPTIRQAIEIFQSGMVQ